MWEVAERIVKEQRINVTFTFIEMPGSEGKTYSFYPLLSALIHVPGAALRVAAEKVWPGTYKTTWALAARLGPSAAGALACALFFALARRFVGVGAATMATVFVGVATAVGF